MDESIDYRRTKYCAELTNIKEKKKNVENMVKEAHPKAQDMHTYISNNSKKFKLEFIEAYNGKCAYCGVSLDLLPKNVFEIDHFLYEKSSKFASKKEAGYIENLVLACRDCNHSKSSFWIDEEYFDKLNPDGEQIKKTFTRDEQYYICISDECKKDQTIRDFYDQLNLGSELHRLDYLLMNIIGLQRKCRADDELYSGLGKIMEIIRSKRNIM